jgi:hypothetical protein
MTLIRLAPALLAALALAACGGSQKGDAPAGADAAGAPGSTSAEHGEAARIASAKAFVTRVYGGDADTRLSPEPGSPDVWDPTMVALYARVDAEQERSGGAILDFEPLCACQDDGGMTWRITDAASPEAGKASVTVTRTIGDDTTDVRLALVDTANGWRLQDVGTDDVPSWAEHLKEGLGEAGAAND